jgi:DMSO/TMAO reductase YedYZ molybdopterin-dependent catalytic subunit
MKQHDASRRSILKGGSAALAGLTVMQVAGPAQAFAGRSRHDPPTTWDDEQGDSSQALLNSGGEVIPWIDQPPPSPFPANVGNILKWEDLNSWHTPTDDFFFVNHYGQPAGLDEATWRVGIGGLVRRPQSLTLADITSLPRHEVDFTLECSGNNGTGLEFFIGGVGNARWGGARLASVLEAAGLLDEGSEVVFWGADRGTVAIRDNSGIVRSGITGTTEPDVEGGLDLTITEQFARSMSLDDALGRDNLLCYEMNGSPLPPEHGFPLRLIAPGWYGVANVKWLTRIEVIDHRYAGRFMARDYVSIREEQKNGETVWTFMTVGHDRLKSAPAKVTRRGGRYAIVGAAWGAPIAAVQVRIDNGPWRGARLYGPPRRRQKSSGYAWRFWTFDWGTPAPGEHRITSRAFDVDGNMQPAPDDPFVASRTTYWESNGHVSRRVLIP